MGQSMEMNLSENGADETSPDDDAVGQVFSKEDPASIARELKLSAELHHKKRTTPYRSAMSMLVFYINRSGKNLPAEQLRILEAAKDELRVLFNKSAK